MAPPKRTHDLYTINGLADDLVLARYVGGLKRSTEEELRATLLQLGDSTDLAAAEDLLHDHVLKSCAIYLEQNSAPCAPVVAGAWRTLLTRPVDDRRKASTVRGEAHKAVPSCKGQPDALRKQEDKLVQLAAQSAFADLQARREDKPASLWQAIHALAPAVAALRDLLHDLLVVEFGGLPPPDPKERRVRDGFHRRTLVDAGRVLLRSTQVVQAGRAHPQVTDDEEWFWRHASFIVGELFDEAVDRRLVLQYMKIHHREDWETIAAGLLATDGGEELLTRWRAWVGSCYPTCVYERSLELLKMCSPHSLLTLLNDVELRYRDLGFSNPGLDDIEPAVHHRVNSPPRQRSEQE